MISATCFVGMQPLLMITPNPALDINGIAGDLVPNEKNYVSGEAHFPGGNAINAARMVHRLGGKCLVTGFVGGPFGEELNHLLVKENIPTEFVSVKGDTRIGITISNEKSHLQTRLSFPGPVILPYEKTKLLDIMKRIKKPALFVIGGSLPQKYSVSDLVRLLKQSRRQGRVILDCPGQILKGALFSKPLLIKPNLLEFQALIGKKVQSLRDVVSQAKKLSHLVDIIVISSVEGGAALVTSEAIVFGRIPKVKVRSTVGAGDSMVGAMSLKLHQDGVHKLSNGELEKYKKNHSMDLLRWGLAASCATLIRSGTTLGTAADVHRYFKKTLVSDLT